MAKADSKAPVTQAANSSEKAKALAAALAQIEKQFGKGSIMCLGSNDTPPDVQVVSTGSLGLDVALGVGGLPRGRVIEIYGPESSGKTSLTLHVVSEMQKLGGTCAFVDAEHALDTQYAQKLGVNLNELLISQPDTGEQALEMVDALVRSGAVDLIIVDSVAALVPRAEIEGDMGDSLPGLQARLMSQALRKLTASIGRSNCTVIFINQIRMKIGVMFGSPETTTGGNALKFYASVRLDIRRIGGLKKGGSFLLNTQWDTIEKLEKHIDTVSYAVVLYTACDEGKAKNETELKKRARQNVVLEHGWLMSKLSRKFVAAIVEDGVEFPGDLSGVVRIPASDWKYDLSKELKVLNN